MNNCKDIIESIRAIVRGYNAEFDISELLYKHKCHYLLSKIDNLNEYTRRAQLENNIQFVYTNHCYNTCKDFFNFLNKNNIQYAVIKGAVLSKVAYGNPYIRKSCDIDILTEFHNLDIIKLFMEKNDFIQGRIINNNIVPLSRTEVIFQTLMSHQTAPYIKNTSNIICPFVNIDINTNIMWGESRFQSDTAYILSQTNYIEICNQKIKKLNAESEFISLCLHHYKDLNSIYLLTVRGIKLYLFCDIYYYLKNNFLNKQLLKSLVQLLNVDKYIYYCLYYVNLIFNDELISDYLDLFAYAEDETVLNSFGLDDSERKSWQIGFYERLFHENIGNYIYKFLTSQDIEKIKINRNYM